MNDNNEKDKLTPQLQSEIRLRRISEELCNKLSLDLRESQSQTAKSAAYLEGLLESSSTGIILTTDTEGLVIMMSSGSEMLLGEKSDTVCHKKKITEFVETEKNSCKFGDNSSKSSAQNEQWVAMTALARSGVAERAERQIITSTGELIPVDLSISPVFLQKYGQQKLEGFLFYGIDIREAKEREDLVLEAGEQAVQAQSEALNMAQESEDRRIQLEEAMAQVEIAEIDLRQSQKRIEEVTSTINEAIWSMNAETQTFTYLSEACEIIFGYLPGDYLNRPDLLECAIHPDDKLTYYENLDLLGHGQRVDFDFRITDAHGKSKWVKAVASPIEFEGDKATRFTGSFSDISELRAATSALQQSEAKVRAILGHVLDGIVTLDSSGKIQMSNPAMSSIFGYATDDLTGKSISELIIAESLKDLNADDPNFMSELFAVVSNSEESAMSAHHKEGQEFPIEIAFSEFKFSDNQFYVAVVRDITERIAQQEFLAQAEKNTAIGALAAGVAHEFKNCLGGILGNASLALDFPGEADLVKESLQTIEEISDKANNIALSLLSYAQTEETEDASCCANSVIQEVKILLENECRERNVKLAIEVDNQLFVSIDAASLQQTLINITLNSIQASKSSDTVNIRGYKENETAIIEIRDSGCGMNEEQQKRAFDPFFSSKGVWGDDAATGQGMGLTTAKNIIQKSGGSVTLTSSKGSGTTVEIKLEIGEKVIAEEEGASYLNTSELPKILLHQFTDSSLKDLENSFNELNLQWKSISAVDQLQPALEFEVGIVFLDGMAPSKIEFVQMFDSIRESRSDIRIVVAIDAVYDYYIADYVKSADHILQLPLTNSNLHLALSLAQTNQESPTNAV